jgi:hypothetical protein
MAPLLIMMHKVRRVSLVTALRRSYRLHTRADWPDVRSPHLARRASVLMLSRFMLPVSLRYDRLQKRPAKHGFRGMMMHGRSACGAPRSPW